MLARIWDKSLAALVATSYVVIVVVGLAQVLFRFVLSSPLSWSEELVRYVFVWSVFLTAAIAFNLNSHISIDFLTSWYPPRLQRARAGLLDRRDPRRRYPLRARDATGPVAVRPIPEIAGHGDPDDGPVRGDPVRLCGDDGEHPPGCVADVERDAGARRARRGRVTCSPRCSSHSWS